MRPPSDDVSEGLAQPTPAHADHDGGKAAPRRAGFEKAWQGISSVIGSIAFRQAVLLVAAVVVTGALVMWLLYGYTAQMLSRQLVETLTVEADGIAAIAAFGGDPAAVSVVAARARTESDRLYYLEDSAGRRLAGNLASWPVELSPTGPGGTFHYRRGATGNEAQQLAAGVTVALPNGQRLLVARDLAGQRQLARHVKWLFLVGFGALSLAGLVAGIAASRLVLRRIGEMTRTTDAVIEGDLSGRVPIAGTGDELDHLAHNLNAMLERIELLMAGLREVSDNIAHDLKTPLSRLRTRAEAALREAGDAADAHEALGRVIEDADELIKTFNALLLIARLEAGAIEGSAEPFDIGHLAEDVAELYEPVAEEAGLELASRIVESCTIMANRQLVGQALANMLDNAIKYGRPKSQAPAGSKIELTVARRDGMASVTVADRGPGIPAAERDRVLKRFVRLEVSRTQPGTGLGLSLVAAVARLHGGRILLEDNDPGLRIVLMLPCRT
ncbi:MAG: ATP-binding protein [Hyphomicrobiaceae bacterium]